MDQQSPVLDWVLLVVLLSAAGLVMGTQNQSLVRSLRAQTLEFTATVESGIAWMGRYVRALKENDELRRENIELSSEVARTRAARQENEELRRLLNLRDTSALDFRSARVVTKDLFRRENLITLDVGREDGIRERMPVVHESGIVGTVTLVSDRYARVMPYLHSDFRVSAAVEPLGAEGIVRWDGERPDRLRLDHIVKTEPVEPGQRVVTSGHSGLFPPGRAIGTVDSVATRPGRSELEIFLRPAVPLYEIRHVFVILDTPDPDRLSLEDRSRG